MKEEERVEDPEFELELLSATDPSSQTNMMSHTFALRLMLTGRLRDEEVPGVMFGACFGINDDQEAFYLALTQADGADRIMIVFDVDDPCGPPIGYGLFRNEGSTAALYGRCSPWTATDGTRTLLVAGNDATDIATYSYQPGGNLQRKPGIPSRNPLDGYRRARARLARLTASPRVREAVGPVYLAVRGGSDGEGPADAHETMIMVMPPPPASGTCRDDGRRGNQQEHRSQTAPRKPLPDDYNITVYSAAEMMMKLENGVGIPLRETIDLELQTLHDLVRTHVNPEDRAAADRLVIVDDETAEMLKDLMSRTVERLRPENRGIAHNVGMTARSDAMTKLGGGSWADRSLTDLEAALFSLTGEPLVALEDADFDAYGAEMNRMISPRPHGRSPILD